MTITIFFGMRIAHCLFKGSGKLFDLMGALNLKDLGLHVPFLCELTLPLKEALIQTVSI